MTAALHPAQLLEASERGGSLHPIDQALLILSLAALDDPSNLPIAERDRRLIELRRAVFGDTLTCTARCPDCGEALEFQLTASGLLSGLRTASPPETITVSGWELALRPLDSHDLAAAARTGDREEAAAVLISRAFDVACRPDGAGDMPEAVLLKVGGDSRHARGRCRHRARSKLHGLPKDVDRGLRHRRLSVDRDQYGGAAPHRRGGGAGPKFRLVGSRHPGDVARQAAFLYGRGRLGMNGVIARLVARALPQPGGARPRAVSRFEREMTPQAAAPGVPKFETDGQVEPSVERPTLSDPDSALPKELVATMPTSAISISRLPRESRNPKTVQRGDETSATVFPRLSAIDVPSAAPPLVGVHGDDALPASTPDVEPPSRDPIASLHPQIVHDQARPRESRSVVELRHAPLLPSHMPSFGPIASALPPRSGQRRDAAPQEPDIHVSIGRIELRAAGPERRPRPVRFGPPALMPLEDYLAGKGKRR